MTSDLFAAYMTCASPDAKQQDFKPLFQIADLPASLFVVDERGFMHLAHPQAEELADGSHLHALHFDLEIFQRGWF